MFYFFTSVRHHINSIILSEEGSRRVKKKKKSSQQATPTTQSSTNDLHPLPYTLRNTHISTKTARDFNKLGFGAGGLPPLAFSHLRRNWYGVTYREKEEEVRGYGDEGSGMGTGECGMGIGNGEEGGMEWSYGPGMGLRAPGTLVGKDEEEGGGGGSEGASAPPTHKRVCLDPKPHPKSGGVVQIPSQQIQRYSGGRGFTRFRSKRALNGEWWALIRGVGSWCFSLCSCQEAEEGEERQLAIQRPRQVCSSWYHYCKFIQCLNLVVCVCV